LTFAWWVFVALAFFAFAAVTLARHRLTVFV
jgi:hypothetical protein